MQTLRDWYAATPAKPTDGLANALLAQEPRGAGGRLCVNFDPALLTFSEEARPSSEPWQSQTAWMYA